MLTLRNIRKEYDGRCVLDVEAIGAEPGRIYAVVGANGSGKSTLLQIAALLLAPTAGEVLLDGRSAAALGRGELAALRRRVCYVSQNPYLFSGTVMSNVLFGLSARGVPRARARERALAELSLLGVEGLSDQRAHTLSAGERQKVALARALVLDVDFLFLDEPTANVDRESVPVVEARVRDLCTSRPVVCLVSTHDGGQARRLAGDDVLHLSAGHLTAGARENVFSGEVVRESGGARLRLAAGGDLWLGDSRAQPGSALATLRPQEVILSLEPVTSSARNSFKGAVTRLEARDGVVWVTVDAGQDILVHLTPQSAEELGLTVNKQVYATFKASALSIHTL